MPWFKRDPIKKLKKAYGLKMEAAMHAMHRGDIRHNAKFVVEANEIKAKIDRLEALDGSTPA